MSVFFQKPIDAIIDEIVMFYLPTGGTIYDPTTGEKQRQIGKLMKGKLDIEYKIITSDIKEGVGQFQCDVTAGIPLKDECVDMVIYDPPFVPHARKEAEIIDLRGKDYGIDIKRSPADIANFYSVKVLEELKRVTRKWLLVRGEDFYFPATSTELYLYHDLAIENIRKAGMRIRGNYTNRFFNPNIPLYRYRLKKYQRPIITHSYITVAEK